MSLDPDPALFLKKKRRFLSDTLQISSWEAWHPYFLMLQDRNLENKETLEEWLLDLSELESVFSETQGWNYIHMTGHTNKPEYEEAFNHFARELEPQAAPFFHAFHKKLISSPFTEKLNPLSFGIYLRSVKNELKIYRIENIPLLTEIDVLSQEYAKIVGSKTISVNGEELTLQKAGTLFKSTNRTLREETFRKLQVSRLDCADELDDLFERLLTMRHKLALQAGFTNFRDYCFAAYGRFDYTAADCFKLHEAVAKEVTPWAESTDLNRKQALNLDELKPWDTEVDLDGKPAILPFKDSRELVSRTIQCFEQIHPQFAAWIRIMDDMGHFDLESRKGKAPGGYNYYLHETGIPYIFMNSVGSVRDLVTMVHEGGHAMHSFLTRDLPLKENKDVPSEVAELASMGMELISMEHWQPFFENPDEMRRARKEHLEKALRSLSWICLVDQFQHWIYEHPEHTRAERREQWLVFSSSFESQVVDWTGVEEGKNIGWQRQLHIYEVPFYYIEYAFAQLGAIALWRNYRKDPKHTIKQYISALQLGYTRTIGELYQTAGIQFDFSKQYVAELATFMKKEIDLLSWRS
ncbi:MAG: M3 family oligoendopeptidase [Bacteroidia bacterium]